MWTTLVAQHTSKQYLYLHHIFTNITLVTVANRLLCNVTEFENLQFSPDRRKKSNGVRPGDLGCHARKLPLPIHLFEKHSFKNYRQCFKNAEALHLAGIKHHNSTVTLYSVLTCPGKNSLSQLLHERKKVVL
jgi:hypothetical protein